MPTLFIANLLRYENLLTTSGLRLSVQAKVAAIAKPILKEVAFAKEGPGGEGAGGEDMQGNVDSGRGATDRAPAPEGQAMGASIHPAAGEV